MSAVRRIAVLRALGGLGDVLCAVPALKRLRHANPDAHVAYIGLPQVRAVVARYPALVDRFVAFPGFPGIPEHPYEPAALREFLAQRAVEPGFDLAIQMHGSGAVTNVFAGLLGARRTVGWHVPGLWSPEDGDCWRFPDELSEVARWTELVARLGFAEGEDALMFPIADAEREAMLERTAVLGGAPYAVIHAGASDPRRRWPVEAFAKIADGLAQDGLRIVLTGTSDEAPLVARVMAGMAMPALDLCGHTGLGEVAALIEGAALVVTNDTGTSHLCAALGTPSVVIFIASDPARWAPADTRRHIAIGTGVPDVPAGHVRPPIPPSHPSVDAVRDAATSLLAFV